MTCIVAKPGESADSLLKRFKKAVEKSGILAEYKKHQVFEKPSVKKKRKRAAAKKRALKELKKLERYRNTNNNKNFRFNKNKTKKISAGPPKNQQNYNKGGKPDYSTNKKPYVKKSHNKRPDERKSDNKGTKS